MPFMFGSGGFISHQMMPATEQRQQHHSPNHVMSMACNEQEQNRFNVANLNIPMMPFPATQDRINGQTKGRDVAASSPSSSTSCGNKSRGLEPLRYDEEGSLCGESEVSSYEFAISMLRYVDTG